MKKIIILCVCLVLIMATFISCGLDDTCLEKLLYGIPIDWPTYEIEGYGYVRLPENWEISYIDGFAYIQSKENGEIKLVCVQAVRQLGEHIESNNYFPEYETSEVLCGAICDNSGYYSKTKFYYKNGSSKEMWIIESDHIYDGNDDGYIELYFVDDTISRDTVRMIAETLFPYSTYE